MENERLFADTNLFLRYLTNDIPAQANAVERLLQRATLGEITLVTSSMVIAEIVWTLESYYQLSRDAIREKVLAILNTPGLEIEKADLLFHAITWYMEENVDFIDAYNAAWMLEQGLATVCTFDRKRFSRFKGIVVKVPTEA